MPLALILVVWMGSYYVSFAGGGLKMGVGNFKQIYYCGEYEYTDADSHVHFYFWQPAAMLALSTILFFILRKSRSEKRLI